MKRISLLLCLWAGCNTTTSVLIEIDGPSAVGNLAITVQRPDRKIDRPLATAGKVLPLPATVIVLLPDVAESIAVTLTGSDDMGRSVQAHQTFQSQPGRQIKLTLTLGTMGDDQSPSSDLAGADLAVPDGADLSSSDLAGFTGADGGGGDMAGSVPSLLILAGLPGTNDTGWDATGLDARFNTPQQPVLIGTSLYFFDFYSSSFRKVDVTNGVATSVPLIDDSTGNAFYHPDIIGLAYDAATSTFYAANNGDHSLYKFSLTDGRVHQYLGLPGTCGSTDSPPRFCAPSGVALDGNGNLFVADSGNALLRQISLANGTVTTVAGAAGVQAYDNGTGSAAHFTEPRGLAFYNSDLYITDGVALRKAVVHASPSPAVVTTVVAAGNGWADAPTGIASAGGGVFYVVEEARNNLQQVTLAPLGVARVAGNDTFDSRFVDGLGQAAYFDAPHWLVLDGAGAAYLTENAAVRKVTLANFNVTSLAGTSLQSGYSDSPPAGDTTSSPARFDSPAGLAFDGADTVYVADYSSNLIRKVSLSTGNTTTWAGDRGFDSKDGNKLNAEFGDPAGLALDGAGNLYVADYSTNTIRKINSNGDVTTIAGIDGETGAPSPSPTPRPGNTVLLHHPDSLEFDGDHTLFFSDAENEVVRAIDLSTSNFLVRDIAGTGVSGEDDGPGNTATLSGPHGLAWDPATHILYVADADSSVIRTIDLTTPASPQVGHLTNHPYAQTHVDGTFGNATFYFPLGLALDRAHHILWVADSGNNCVRRLDLAAKMTSTPIGTAGVPVTKAGPLPSFVHGPWGVLLTPRGLLISSWDENTVLLATGLQ